MKIDFKKVLKDSIKLFSIVCFVDFGLKLFDDMLYDEVAEILKNTT